jgi:hypothetical protein
MVRRGSPVRVRKRALTKAPQTRGFCFPAALQFVERARPWDRFWNSQAKEAGGKEGAHQIRNDTDAPVRVLMLSTLIAPDIVEYLDTGKIGARSVAGERIIFARPGPELEYWEDED